MTRYTASYYATIIGLVTFFLVGGPVEATNIQGVAPTGGENATFDGLVGNVGAYGVTGFIIITAFKFFVGRQEKADIREDAVVTSLRNDIQTLRNELAEERRRHDDTRHKLHELLMRYGHQGGNVQP